MIAGQAAVISEYQNATASQAAANAAQRENDEATIRRTNQGLSSSQAEVAKLKSEINSLLRELDDYEEKLKERDALILEWTMSNEVCRKLAIKYKEKLGLTPEQVKADNIQAAKEVVENNPSLKNTDFYKKINIS